MFNLIFELSVKMHTRTHQKMNHQARARTGVYNEESRKPTRISAIRFQILARKFQHLKHIVK